MTAASALRRFGTAIPKGRGVVVSALHPASRSARSLFPSRVFDPHEVDRVLKDGHQSRKIGKTVMKGHRKGWPIYTLTLEERASCPRACAAWSICYGNNMQAAERIVHGDALVHRLGRELAELQVAHPGGFLVRLHVLGDFWSVGYVGAWRQWLDRFPALAVFGFTAHPAESPIGGAVLGVMHDYWGRWHVRFSGAPSDFMAARLVEAGESDPDAILCPAQTGATDCCATCALCWQSDRSIAFRPH
jgi:hypothetical protein